MIRNDYAANNREGGWVFDGVRQTTEGVRVVPKMTQYAEVAETAQKLPNESFGVVVVDC